MREVESAGASEAARFAACLATRRGPPALGLEGDRHVTGGGTLPSGLPGSALTLIEREVCASFSRLCEPCTVVERYASRPVRRPLVHRGGLRADILDDGVIRVGDPVRVP